MHFSATSDYPADVNTVAAMLADEDFARRRAAATDPLEQSTEVTRDGEAFTVTTKLKMPTTMVPPKFRSFAPSSLNVTLVEAWTAPAADGVRTSTFNVDIQGVPAKVRGTQKLAPSAAGSTKTYDGEVTASIPLVGKKMEQMAVAAVDKIVQVERRIALEYLAER